MRMPPLTSSQPPAFLAAALAIIGITLSIALPLSACSAPQDNASSTNQQVPTERPEIIAEHPWDSGTFTQGVEMAEDGTLIVGAGMYGQSRIYRSTLDGQQSNTQRLSPELFGEGITIDGNTVWQLTWKAGVAIHRDAGTLEETGRVNYQGEGWGICSDGTRLVMSNGSGTLTFRDPQTFDTTGTVDVSLNGKPTAQLNELECTDDGQVLANVWQTDKIYRIDPTSGKVTGVIDTAGVFPAKDKPGADVLNGIAQIPGTDRFLVTGKYWDTLYEVRFAPVVP